VPCRLERGRGSAETSRATKTRQAVAVLYVLPTIWICFCSCEGYDPAAKKAACRARSFRARCPEGVDLGTMLPLAVICH